MNSLQAKLLFIMISTPDHFIQHWKFQRILLDNFTLSWWQSYNGYNIGLHETSFQMAFFIWNVRKETLKSFSNPIQICIEFLSWLISKIDYRPTENFLTLSTWRVFVQFLHTLMKARAFKSMKRKIENLVFCSVFLLNQKIFTLNPFI